MNGGKFFSRVQWLAFWVTYAVVQAVYVYTLAPTVTLEDSGELVTAAAELGVPHPPGYPFWTVVTWLFIKIVPFGNIAWRANLCSSFFGALSCGIVALITAFLAQKFSEASAIRKNLPNDKISSLLPFAAGSLAGLSLGFLESLWYQSVITEVYSLNAFVFALMLLFMLRWLYAPERLVWGFLTFLSYGLGLTSHQTLLLFSPALLVFLAFVNWRILRDLLPYVLMAGSTMCWCTRNKFAITVTAILYATYAGMLYVSLREKWDAERIVFLGISLLFPIAAGYLAAECVNDVSTFSTLTNLIEFRWAVLTLVFCVWSQFLMSFTGSWRVVVPYALGLACAVAIATRNEYAMGVAIALGGYLAAQIYIDRRHQFGPRQAAFLAASLLLPLLAGFAGAVCAGQDWDFPNSSLAKLPFFVKSGPQGLWIAGIIGLSLVAMIQFPLASAFAREVPWNGRRALLLIMAGLLGLSVYVYMPLSAKTNPPMNWGYTATVSGFVHSVTRGQYDPIKEGRKLGELFKQIEFYYTNLVSNYTLPIGLLAILALIGVFDSNPTEKKYSFVLLIGWTFLSLFLTYLANTTFEEQTLFIVRVFYATSHMIFSIWVGLGVVMLFALVNQIRSIQSWLVALAFVTVLLLLAAGFDSPFLVYPKLVFFVFLFIIFLWLTFRVPFLRWGRYIAVFLLPVILIANNGWRNDWRPWGSDQRGHDFGWMFGYDMLKDMDRDAVVFGGTDPGRFVPTYMIFVESFAKPENRYWKGRDFDRRDLYLITQNALADSTYMEYIRDHYTDRRPKTYNWFERWLGRDKAYPNKPILIPEDDRYNELFKQVCEQLQNQPGSGITIYQDDKGMQRVGAQGVNAIFAINGAIARDIFENNKQNHTFYVEESFPLDWMYPYLEPFGLIMKMNKEPMAKIPDEVVRKDMAFWSDYTHRLLADPKFLDDIVARRAFAKLRASIGGLYVFRGMAKEAEIALNQSVSLFGGSSEGCSRLIELLIRQERYDEARVIGVGWMMNDTENKAVSEVLTNIAIVTQMSVNRLPLTLRFQSNPTDTATFLELSAVLASLQKIDELDTVVARYLKNPQHDSEALQKTVNLYNNTRQMKRLVKMLSAEAKSRPTDYQIWYSLAVAQALDQKIEEGLASLKKAVTLNGNLKSYAVGDPRLDSLRGSSEFPKITQ